MISTVKLSDFLHLRHLTNKEPLEITPEGEAASDSQKEKQSNKSGSILFVYLRHHLVFKTDIVISVNVHTKDARAGEGRSHIPLRG
jgi:hypothetical protein